MARISPRFFAAYVPLYVSSARPFAASISAAISIFSAPGADTRLRAGDVPGERAPADPATIENRKRVAEPVKLGVTEAEWNAIRERIEKDRAAMTKPAELLGPDKKRKSA
jgi:hypothetical protein